jgi:hypothetical protein
LRFERNYNPAQYFEGNRGSRVWVVGLNPKGDNNTVDNRTVEELQGYFDNGINNRYFRVFHTVSERLYNLFRQDGGACHTDVVKCYSNQFPDGVPGTQVINNCRDHFQQQLREYTPEIIICNGIPVCDLVQQLVQPPDGLDINAASYIGNFEDKMITVILSGFIGRQMDRYSKRRLGREIDEILAQHGFDI